MSPSQRLLKRLAPLSIPSSPSSCLQKTNGDASSS
jgi:hypothetical protein